MIYGYIKNKQNSSTSQYAGRMPFKTGQVVSYDTGDDGDTQRGNPFFDLPIINGVQQLNPFGSKKRFTGINGGTYSGTTTTAKYKDRNGNIVTYNAAFPQDIRCDWSTLQGDNFLMFIWDNEIIYKSIQEMIENVSSISNLFTGWKVPNINELMLLWHTMYDLDTKGTMFDSREWGKLFKVKIDDIAERIASSTFINADLYYGISFNERSNPERPIKYLENEGIDMLAIPIRYATLSDLTI